MPTIIIRMLISLPLWSLNWVGDKVKRSYLLQGLYVFLKKIESLNLDLLLIYLRLETYAYDD